MKHPGVILKMFYHWEIGRIGGLLHVASKGDGYSYEPRMPTSEKPLYRVAATLHEPWIMAAGDGYKGFIVNILDEISLLAGFEYTIQTPGDGTADNNYNYSSRPSGGILFELMAGMADIGVADLHTADDRTRSVFFSEPFITTGAQILLKKPTANPNTCYLLQCPLADSVWIILFATIVVMVGAFCLINCFSPCGWGNLSKKDRRLYNGFDFRNGISCIASIQGDRNAPTSLSGRLLMCFCCIFTVLVAIAYSSSLTAVLLSSGGTRPVLPFKTYTEMAGQSDVVYGGWFGMILNPNDQLQRNMDRFMTSKFSHYTSLQDAVTRMRTSSYAAIVPGFDGEYLAGDNCDLMLLREELFRIDYGFACRPGPEGDSLCANISQAIVQLTEDGTLFRLRSRWWSNGATCPKTLEEEYVSGAHAQRIYFRPLTLADFSLCFYFLLIGFVLSLVALVAEVICYRTHPDVKASGENSFQEETNYRNSRGSLAEAETPEPETVIVCKADDSKNLTDSP